MQGFVAWLIEWGTAFQNWLFCVCISVLSLMSFAAVVAVGIDAFRKERLWLKLKASWRESRILTLVLLVAVAGIIKVGATKNQRNYGADENICLVDWETNFTYGEPYQDGVDPDTGDPVIVSNRIAFTWVFTTTNNICPNPISYRASSTNYWANVMQGTTGWSAERPVLTSVNGITNVWTLTQSDYAAYTNVVDAATSWVWYVGNDLPAVEVKVSELLTLDRVEAHSNGFKLYWTVDPSIDFQHNTVVRDTEEGRKTFSFDSATVTITVTGGQGGGVTTMEDYDGTVTEAQIDGFLVSMLRTIYVKISLNNVLEVGE